jgi:hypothetical protein
VCLHYLPDVASASRTVESEVTGTPAGVVVVRSAGLRFHGGTVTAGDAVPAAGELAVFCRPVVTAAAVVRRDGTVLADAWLPDLVRLGELERHLGDGMIEAIVAEALEKGRLKRRQRRRIMSYPLVIRLMIAMTLMPDGSYCESLARLAGQLAVDAAVTHDSFSRAIRSTTDRTFRCVAGRPDRAWRYRRDHRRRTMSRCHPKMVPGVTISRIAARRSIGSVPASRASNARSGHVSRARAPVRSRPATASWWRSMRISASFHHASRRDKPSSGTARETIRKISFRPTSRRSSHLR